MATLVAPSAKCRHFRYGRIVVAIRLSAARLGLALAALLAAVACSTSSKGIDGWGPSDFDDTGSSDFGDMEDYPFAENEDFSDEDESRSVAEICVRKTTMLRTAYRPCDDAQKGNAWYYLTLDAKIPAVGKRPKSGSFESPDDDRVRVSNKGGSGEAIALSDDADRVEVCVRTSTRVRTGDVHGDDGDGGYDWYYIPISHRIPRVGARAGSCYRSRTWANTLAAAGITHKRTRPYRPQTNGKVERFNRTLLDEWAYAKPYFSEQERRDAFPVWLHNYNHHRRHTALKGASTRQSRPQPLGSVQLAVQGRFTWFQAHWFGSCLVDVVLLFELDGAEVAEAPRSPQVSGAVQHIARPLEIVFSRVMLERDHQHGVFPAFAVTANSFAYFSR